MSYALEKSNVSFPTSQIKPPGFLLKDKKDAVHTRKNRQRIQSLLVGFKSNIPASLISSFVDSTFTGRKESSSDDDQTFFESFIKTHCPNFEMSPGKLKRMTDQTSIIIHQAEEILAVYGLDLIIKDSQDLKEIVNFLRVLIPEICFFPSDFFQKIEIKHIIICKAEKNEEISGSGSAYFPLAILATKENISRAFHKLILDRIIQSFPNIVKIWEKIQLFAREEFTSSEIMGYNLEETFVGLMNQTKYAPIKPQINKLRELLENYYPEAMSEERFVTRGKERKKTVRVHFDC